MNNLKNYTLGDLFELIPGFAFKSEDFEKSGVGVLKARNIRANALVLDNLTYVNAKWLKIQQEQKALPGDLLLVMSDYRKSKAKSRRVGKIARFHFEGDFLIDRQIGILRPKTYTNINTKCCFYFLASDLFQSYLSAIAISIVDRPKLLTQQILDAELFLPSVSEQDRIASLLEAIDEKIEQHVRLNDELEEGAKSIFKSWFVDFEPTRAKARGHQPTGLSVEVAALFPDQLDGDDKPAGWARVPVVDLVDFNPTERIPVGQLAPYFGMATLSSRAQSSAHPIPMPFLAGSKFRNGDALLAGRSPSLRNGKAAFVQNLDLDQIGWGSAAFIVMRTRKPLSPAYGYLLCRDQGFRKHAIHSMTGTAGQKQVRIALLKKYLVSKPPGETVFRAFTRTIAASFDTIEAHSRQIKTLSDLRDCILPKLMSGELPIDEAERSVQAVL